MTDPEGSVTEFQTFVKDVPEFIFVLLTGAGDVHQIDGHDALVEAAVILMFAALPVFRVSDVANPGVRETIRCQETSAVVTV